jgi:hypothetical protein
LTAAWSPGRWLWLSSHTVSLPVSYTTSHISKHIFWNLGRPFVKNVFHLCSLVYWYGILGVLALRLTFGSGELSPE